MRSEIIDLQNTAVTKLVGLTKNKNSLVYKAPTGSGKTYMMADYMNRILEENENVVFIVSTLSQGGLAQQNYNKFIEYMQSGKFEKLKPYLISSEISGEESLFIPLNYNVYILPRDIYRQGARLMQGPMMRFLESTTDKKWLNGLEKDIYLIKDECHIATSNLDDISNFFTKTINFSATPNLGRGQYPDVNIKEEDAEKVKLIKEISGGYKTPQSNGQDLEEAIQKFKEVKGEYERLIPDYTPCMIIQVSSNYLNNKKGDEEIEKVISVLSQHNLRWMVLVEDGKKGYRDYGKLNNSNLPKEKWKEYVKENNSPYDVVIFKMVVSAGYDIPRACMLYQLRGVQEEILSKQVIGRVRRVPHLVDFENLNKEAQELATKAYVWAKPVVDNQIGVKLDQPNGEIADNLKVKTTVLKPLNDKADFNLDEILDSSSSSLSSFTIFENYKELKKCDSAIVNMCYEYSTSYDRWWKFCKHLSEIKKKYSTSVCDYQKSMELSEIREGVTFAPLSRYVETDNNLDIRNWVWVRNDGKNGYSFDSYAEKKWADFLAILSNGIDSNLNYCIASVVVGDKNPKAGQLDMDGNVQAEKLNQRKRFLWGKNFLPNSEIKFEYYLDGVHSSYPDFIMKDAKGRIHIFEVKSINESGAKKGLDKYEYSAKVIALMDCYKQASKLTNQIFYIPLLEKDSWTIYIYKDGKEMKESQSRFEEFVKGNIDL